MLRETHGDANLLDGISSCQKHTCCSAMHTVVFGPQRSVGWVPLTAFPEGNPCPTRHIRAHLCRAITALLVACLMFPSHLWGSFSAQGTPLSPKYTCPYAFLLISPILIFLSVCQGRAALAATDHHLTTLTFAMPHEQHNHASVPTVTSRPTEMSRVTSDIRQQLDVTFPMALFFSPSKSQQKRVIAGSFQMVFNNATCK